MRETDAAIAALLTLRDTPLPTASSLDVLERVCGMDEEAWAGPPQNARPLAARAARLIACNGDVASIPVLSERARHDLRLQLAQAASDADIDRVLQQVLTALLSALQSYRHARLEAIFQSP